MVRIANAEAMWAARRKSAGLKQLQPSDDETFQIILKSFLEVFDWTVIMNYKSSCEIGVKEDHPIKNTGCS
jgi:hypothetical protein